MYRISIQIMQIDSPVEAERVFRSFFIYDEEPTTQFQIIPVAIAESDLIRNEIQVF